jgi:hypothetical protein
MTEPVRGLVVAVGKMAEVMEEMTANDNLAGPVREMFADNRVLLLTMLALLVRQDALIEDSDKLLAEATGLLRKH